MRAVVVGYGSIGERHARVLGEIGCTVAVVSRRDVDVPVHYSTVEEAVKDFQPDYIVIASATVNHETDLRRVRATDFSGLVLVEKPLFSSYRDLSDVDTNNVFVVYNLRFHPVMQRLYELLRGERILTFHAYIGQYLPTWRPGRDYRDVYSAHAEQGGGVLRDLSHEMDYVQWMCGRWKQLTARGGHLSSLEITSDDVYSLLVETDRVPVATIQINYLDRISQRTIVVNTEEHTLKADLIAGTLQMDDRTEQFTVVRDQAFRDQHRAVIENRREFLCSFDDGNDIMHMIEAAEKANSTQTWISR